MDPAMYVKFLDDYCKYSKPQKPKANLKSIKVKGQARRAMQKSSSSSSHDESSPE